MLELTNGRAEHTSIITVICVLSLASPSFAQESQRLFCTVFRSETITTPAGD